MIGQNSWRAKDDLTVNQVYKELCAIEEMSGTGSQEEKINALVELLKQVDPLSARYIVRIIIGKLRLGFSDMTIVDALSWMELRIINHCVIPLKMPIMFARILV